MSEHLIRTPDGVHVAVRDSGGDGPAALLLHGRGRDSQDWHQVAPLLLNAGLRVVTMDLRGHGGSDPAPWGWDEALADVESVVNHLGLTRPAVIGHSLGGMVATLWARSHADCPLAVNLDGHQDPKGPHDYAGLDPDEALAAHAAVTAFFAELDAEEEPDPALEQYLGTFEGFDLVEVYRAARCPLLVVCAEHDEDEEDDELSPEVVEAFAAHRRGLVRDLAAVSAQNPLVSFTTFPTTHEIHLEAPEDLAKLLLGRIGTTA
ncbi:alpha/beta fold hydrolase [Streptoalloteichus hindustanus]|uniref:alpha/beta fold hydrolase n=1 Tax=Streptoalloteichus hindustanus TaxID=2017 RepID=UPI000937D6CA|nr:alpha/beta hydrolase [Streptoalloteichus hindustanus]